MNADDNWEELSRPVIKEWKQKLEDEGFDIPKDGLFYDVSFTQGSGTSFRANVDVIRFLRMHDPDEKQYPRAKELYKQDKYKVTILKISHQYQHEYTMQVSITDDMPDEEDTEDVKDFIDSAIEGGGAIDKIAELGDWILETARTRARELHKQLENVSLENSEEN